MGPRGAGPGKLWYAVPHLGRASTWLNPTNREQLAQILAGLLFMYALVMFAKPLVVGRRRTPTACSPPVLEDVSA